MEILLPDYLRLEKAKGHLGLATCKCVALIESSESEIKKGT